ncbi:MAG: ATP-binding protein [Syntrophorhabdaceae bacterium]|nr:ATP-binding protein [Syntrophorhabdaceae bacterium]
MNPVEILGKIIEISHSNLEANSRISAILNIISQEMGFEEVIVFTYEKDKRLTSSYMNRKSTLFKIFSAYRCHIGEGIIGSVAQKRMPQSFTKRDVPLRLGCLFYPELDDHLERFKSFLFQPITDDSFLYGVLFLASASKELIQDHEKILTSIIAREIGGVLQVHKLHVSSKRKINELATLSELGKLLTSHVELPLLFQTIGLIVTKATEATFFTIRLEHKFLLNGPERFSYGDVEPFIKDYILKLENEVWIQKKTLSIRNIMPVLPEMLNGYAIYSTPIISRDGVIGTVTICGTKNRMGFTFEEDGQGLINNIANYITNGVENTILTSKLRELIKELNKAQKRAIEQEKLKSLGEMTANIAHEIKNPLVVIGGFANRLLKKAKLTHGESRYAEIIVKEVARLESILNVVLRFAKEDESAPCKPCNINACLDEIVYLFNADPGWEKVQIEKEYDCNLPPVVCDIEQVKQVIINIMLNAYEAMFGEGKIHIKTGRCEKEPDRFLTISITDTGGGIDPAIIDNIFNPFFTTKEKGTGLGLAISNKIINNLRGKIEIINKVGQGATFSVYLPLKNGDYKEELI